MQSMVSAALRLCIAKGEWHYLSEYMAPSLFVSIAIGSLPAYKSLTLSSLC